MKKLILAILTAGIVVSCNTVKNTTAKVHTGNYDDAIEVTLHKLRKNPEKKRKQEYVLLLEEAYAKAVTRDTERIEALKSTGNKNNLQDIFDTYLALEHRQQMVKPFMPLKVIAENRNAYFTFSNYVNDITSTRDALAAHLYSVVQTDLNNATSKEDYRNLYYNLAHLDNIKPGYRNVGDLMNTAHQNGIDYVNVALYNDSHIALPRRLEADLLDFSSYGLDNFWTVYHSYAQNNVDYDYHIDVAFTEINISPEHINERTFRSEKIIKDGTTFLKDDDGNYILDEDGNKIEVDNMVKVRARYFEYAQNKAVNLVGRVQYSDAKSGQVIESFPLVSEFIFDHRYATYRGDKRALDRNHYELTYNSPLAFPTNEEMIYDAGNDVKNRLKNIIKNNGV